MTRLENDPCPLIAPDISYVFHQRSYYSSKDTFVCDKNPEEVLITRIVNTSSECEPYWASYGYIGVACSDIAFERLNKQWGSFNIIAMSILMLLIGFSVGYLVAKVIEEVKRRDLEKKELTYNKL